MACGLKDWAIKIFNYTSGELINTLYGHRSQIFNLLLINDQVLASSEIGPNPLPIILIWNTTNSSIIYTLSGHTDGIFGLRSIAPNLLASSSKDFNVNIWDLTSGRLLKSLKNHSSKLYYDVDLYTQDTLITASYDLTVKFWEISTGEVIETIYTNLQSRALAMLENCKHKLIL